MAGYLSETADDLLDSELECVICRDAYNDPVELSCGHNFCRQCLLQCVENSKDSYNCHYDNLDGGCDCPICRKRHYFTVQMVTDMQGNLKLRNIIAAVQEKARKKPTNCFTHKKAYVLFCKDCNDIKCLTCFMDACTKGHQVEDIEVTASKVKEQLAIKKEQMQERKLWLDEYGKKTVQIQKDMKSLSQAIAHASLLRGQLMTSAEKEIQETCDRLSSMDKWNIVRLVQSRELLSTIEIPFPTKSPTVEAIDEALEEFEKNLANTIQKLTSTITDSGSTSITQTEKTTQSSDCSVNNIRQVLGGADYNSLLNPIAQSSGTDTAGTNHLSDYDSYALRFGLADASSVNDLQQSRDSLRNRFTTPLPPFYQLIQSIRTSVSPVATFQFRSELIETVNLIGDRFYLCTNEALHLIVDDHSLTAVQQGSHFTACCAIDEFKTLVCFPQMVEVHRNDSLFSRSSIFSILVQMPIGAKITSVGVSDSEPKLYFISDERRFCIHVWNSQTRLWMQKIYLRNYTEFHRFYNNFKFVMYHDILYVSILHEGRVIAINLSGELVWSNNTNVEGPNGVFATSDYLYVCDNDGIVLLDITNGRLKGLLPLEGTIQSWSLAVSESRLALVHPVHLHNMSRSSVQVHIYNLPQLMATYLHTPN